MQPQPAYPHHLHTIKPSVILSPAAMKEKQVDEITNAILEQLMHELHSEKVLNTESFQSEFRSGIRSPKFIA